MKPLQAPTPREAAIDDRVGMLMNSSEQGRCHRQTKAMSDVGGFHLFLEAFLDGAAVFGPHADSQRSHRPTAQRCATYNSTCGRSKRIALPVPKVPNQALLGGGFSIARVR